ncbi:MAG: protease-4, partial [Alphaproteobacteria bacterium]
SPIKGEPNYFSNTPPEALENLQNMVEDTNLWFQNLVKERRPNIMPENFSSLTNGSVFTGQQAVNNKLIDAIGGQFEAKSYLIKHYKFDESINIESVSLEESSDDFLINQIFNMFMGHFFKTTGNFWPTSRNNVDGLLSLWHS